MRVLWLCHFLLPALAEEFQKPAPPYGGWITGLLNDLRQNNNIEMKICSLTGENKHGIVDGIEYWGYKQEADNISYFKEVIKESKPDIIHIWGTETKRSLEMMQVAYSHHLEDHTVISIQGLVSVIGKYHYYAYLPPKVVNSHRLVEIRYGHSIKQDCDDFIADGKYELQTLNLAKNVIGRTDWDNACVKQINANVKYYHCGESLRDSFYQAEWNLTKTEKHSIFISQANYPLKGAHIMLEAMPFVLKQFPDAKLYLTGESPLTAFQTFHGRIRQRSYPRYLAQLITKYHLEDHVFFTGLLKEEDMRDRYLKSHVFVSPSSIENSSNSIGEAMLLGMPVVASDVGGVKNFMEHDKEGYLYQSDAPYMLAYYICKVFDDDDRAVKMGQCARKHALLSYDREKNLKDMLQIYQEIAR